MALRFIGEIQYRFKRLSQELAYAARDVSAFSPSPTPKPHWQDLVFGDGRAAKLLDRLKSLPHVTQRDQKELMGISGGIDVLPENLELVKYGLNDLFLSHMIENIWANALVKDDKRRNLPQTITLDSVQGFVDEESREPLSEFSDRACSQRGIHWQLNGMYDKVYDDLDYYDPILQMNITREIEKAVLAWAVQDVLPVVPRMVRDYVASPNEDGTITLHKGDNHITRYAGHTPDFYLALRRDYKGTLPDYDAQIVAQTEAPTTLNL